MNVGGTQHPRISNNLDWIGFWLRSTRDYICTINDEYSYSDMEVDSELSISSCLRGILEAHNKCELSIKIVKARMLHWNPYDNDDNRQNQAMCKIRVNNLFSSPFDCAQDYINSKSQLNFFFKSVTFCLLPIYGFHSICKKLSVFQTDLFL